MTPSDAQVEQARKLSLLGIILLALHPLFGLTAVIGMIVSTMSLGKTEGTIYHSHLKWQISTFWIGLVAYAIGFVVWNKYGVTFLVIITFFFVAYRISINLKHWVNREALNKNF